MKIALVQMNSVIGDFAGNVGKIVELSRKALVSAGPGREPGLVVFPELAVCGYPPMDLLDQRTFVEANLSALRALQKALPPETAVSVGYVDKNRSGSGRTLVNAFSVIWGGKIVFTQAKTLLPTYDVFDEARYFEPASVRKVFTPSGGRIGFAICEDFWWEAPPSLSFTYEVDPVKDLLDSSIDVLIVPSASPFVAGKIKTRLGLARGSTGQGRIPVLYCNAVGANDSLVFDGRSFAMRPDGSVAGICGWGEEILFFDTANFEAESLAVEAPDTGSPRPAALDIDEPVEELHRAIVVGISDYMRKSGFSKACLGLSGGIDSALVAILAAEAIGPGNIVCLTMPSRFSSEGSVNDSIELCGRAGIRLERLSIEALFKAYLDLLAVPFAGRPFDLAEENLQARIRGSLLMAWSNKFNTLLLTTGNKSEMAAGYCTLYGDMCGAIAPIGDLYKTEVYALARHLNALAEKRGAKAPIPDPILNKAPSAELRLGQKDQDSLPEYETLDAILKQYIEENRTSVEIVSLGFDPCVVTDVLNMTAKAEYKRRQAAPVIKVSKRAFGVGRRLPLARHIHETEV
ncbi:MAG: NAD+ synthase [Spirochaetes bacterium]|nr:NAD+ synthase [Spirochaetota bacterium]